MHKILNASLLALALATTACPETEDDTAQINGGLLVVTSDYQSGSYSVVDENTFTATASIQVIHSDALCRFDLITGTPFIVTREGGDAVEILNPQNGWAVEKEYSVGSGSNPHDLAVASKDLAFVTLFNIPELLVVNPLTGVEQGRIDLSEYADEDGNPEAEGVLYLNGKVYVTLTRLDSNYTPAAAGGLVVLDAATSTIENFIEMTGTNPSGRLRHSAVAGGLVLIEWGSFGVLDGGVEIYDPSQDKLSGFVITEDALEGEVLDAVVASPNIGYATIGTLEGTTKLVSFDPAAGTKTSELIVSSGWDLYYLELDPSGTELWVADRTPEKPGLRVYDASTAEPLTDEPIDVGLPPFMMCFAP